MSEYYTAGDGLRSHPVRLESLDVAATELRRARETLDRVHANHVEQATAAVARMQQKLAAVEAQIERIDEFCRLLDEKQVIVWRQ